MKKPVIAVDIDEVLMPHFQNLINWYNKEYGTKLTMAHNHPTDPRPWGADNVPEVVKRVHRYFETPILRNAKPYKEAAEVLRTLSRTYDLVVITARDEIVEKSTREWLNQHFLELFKEAHFTARYSQAYKGRSKVDVCLRANASYLIDDALHEANEAAQKGIRVLLFGDYPWNQAKQLPKNVVRVNDWGEVKEYFDAKG